jgi:hypothetical protein
VRQVWQPRCGSGSLVTTGYVAVTRPPFAPTRTAPAEERPVVMVIAHRDPAPPHPGLHVPGGHPWALGAGLTGLVVATVLRRRTHETRDEPRVLGLTF